MGWERYTGLDGAFIGMRSFGASAPAKDLYKHFGITVICNLHSLDTARVYCDRLVGMAQGRVVFDDVPQALTDDVARELYGLDADEVMDTAGTALPLPTQGVRPSMAVA